MTRPITFRVNACDAAFEGAPGTRLLDALREVLHLYGTKEGCGEGECGACTVLLDGAPVCACLVPMCQVEGSSVTTVEGIARGKELSAVQEELVRQGGVQCGACTPGIVVSAWSHLQRSGETSRAQVAEALSGNLCRCTGYERIFQAVLSASRTISQSTTKPQRPLPAHERAPLPLSDALQQLKESGVTPIAGATDLLVADHAAGRRRSAFLDLRRIPELNGIREWALGLDIGAAVTFAELRASPLVQQKFPVLVQMARTIGALQIQERATLGGNIANASPAGDSLPLWLVLDAEFEIAGSSGLRCVSADHFFVDYRRTALRASELLTRIRVKNLPSESFLRFTKVGTRAAQAISKVVVAFSLRTTARGAEARLAAGSVAATPVRLPTVEEYLATHFRDAEAPDRAGTLAAQAVTPIDDVRSTATYRRFVLARIVRRLVQEAQSALPG